MRRRLRRLRDDGHIGRPNAQGAQAGQKRISGDNPNALAATLAARRRRRSVGAAQSICAATQRLANVAGAIGRAGGLEHNRRLSR